MVLLAAILAQGQVVRLMTINTLGTAGWEALTNPDSVTVVAVHEPGTYKKGDLKVGRRVVVRFGPIKSVPKADYVRLRKELISPTLVRGVFCVFEPDHLIQFKRRKHAISILTCFTCKALDADFDGQRLLTGHILFDNYPSLRAIVEKQFSAEEEASRRRARDAAKRQG